MFFPFTYSQRGSSSRKTIIFQRSRESPTFSRGGGFIFSGGGGPVANHGYLVIFQGGGGGSGPSFPPSGSTHETSFDYAMKTIFVMCATWFNSKPIPCVKNKLHFRHVMRKLIPCLN